VEDVNREAGGLVVPLGIHSAVNGFTLDVDPEWEDDVPAEAASAFAAKMRHLAVRIAWLDAHRKARTSRLADELGFRTDRPVKLHKFVDKCRDRGFDERQAFDDLLEAVQREHASG